MNNEDCFDAVVDLMRQSTGSIVKGYKLPQYFTNLPSWQENYGARWSDMYYADVAEFIGEEFNWVWMPLNFRFMNEQEYSEAYPDG